jgi:hypothetical protein
LPQKKDSLITAIATTRDQFLTTPVTQGGLLKAKAVPPHAMKALVGRGVIAPTHSRPRHYMGVSGQSNAPAAL